MNLALPDIRLAHSGDADRIAAMSRDYIEQGLAWSWTGTRVLRSIEDRSSNVAIIGASRAVLGFGIMQYGDDTAHLALLGVHPAQRSRGFGARLLSWLEQPARVAGIHTIGLEVRADNPRALAFYQRCGFSVVATVGGYYQGRIDAVRLQKWLIERDRAPLP